MSFVAVAVGGAALIAGGIASNAVATGKANKAANKMEALSNTVPQAKESSYPGLMIDQAKNELNAQNPFLAAQQRGIQATQVNSQAVAQRNGMDAATLLDMTQKYNAMSQDATMKNMMANYGIRENKLQDLYKGYQMGQQQDQMNYDNSMTAFNSKANLQNAAGQTRVAAWQNLGNNLMSTGGSMVNIAASGYKGTGKPN